MYMAVIEGWSNVISFASDKEEAKNKAVAMAKELYEDEVNTPHGLDEWSWSSLQEYFGSYIVKIEDGLVMNEDSMKCGRYADNVIYE